MDNSDKSHSHNDMGSKKFEDLYDEIDDRLAALLEPEYPEEIYSAMFYSVSAGGKRVRPMLLITAYEAVSGREHTERELDFACALEMIHTYSLIHDDLPAMDDDDYRRGHLTNHKVYGEALAILAGDALLNKAFEVMLGAMAEKSSKALLREVEAMRLLAAASGTKGMIGGQVADMLSEGKEGDETLLKYIHTAKTAALIQASIAAGAALAGADDEQMELLKAGGESLGFAFQIQDDILDVTSTLDELGKSVNSDEKNKKLTYVSVMGMEQAKADYREFSENADNLLKDACGNSDLTELAEALMNRTA